MLRTTLSRSTGTVVVIAALLGVTTAAAVATAGTPSDAPEAERLRATEVERMRALVDADMAVVERLHADDFELVPPPGIPLSRNDYVAAVAAGAIDYRVFEPVSELEVRLYGQAAAIRYRSRIDVTVAGLGQFATEAWHTYVYERIQGRWQVVWEQATAVGGFPPAAG